MVKLVSSNMSLRSVFIAVILLLVLVGSAEAVSDVSSCSTLSTSDVYVPGQNLSNSTCINTTSSNAVFDRGSEGRESLRDFGVGIPNVKQSEEQEAFRRHQKKAEYREGELLVKFKPGITREQKSRMHSDMNSMVLREFKGVKGLQLLELPPGEDVKRAIEYYKDNPLVEYAEPNYIVEILATPNDPRFGDLWGMEKINATEAWDITTGSGDVVVAVIDTGVDYTHEDLGANIWVNVNEIPDNGIDDDNNGFVDDVRGWDFSICDLISSEGTCVTPKPRDNDPFDNAGHGTHVSGTIGAVGNNGIGVVGVNWNVSIMAVQFLGASGAGTTADAIYSLDYVLGMKNRGVNVVATSNSWGGGGYSQSLKDAIEAQMNAGILFIAAAGNGGQDGIGDDNDVFPAYPASFDLPNIISVAAINSSDALASFSNFGEHSVDVGAPGVGIFSTLPPGAYLSPRCNDEDGDGYGYCSGTSMATPHVSGLAALLKVQNSSLDWKQIKNLILTGGRDTPALRGKTVTGRTINAYGSLTCTNSSLFSVQMQDYSFLGETVELRALSITCSRLADVNVTVYDSNGSILDVIPLLDDGVPPDWAAGDGVFVSTWTPSEVGSYVLTFNNTVEVKSLNITVDMPKTRVVNQTSNCTTGDAYYGSIQEAVTDANRGDKVIVCPGTYTERVSVGKSLDIKSYTQNPEDTVILGYGIYADGINISGFKIEGGADYIGIWISSSSNSLITNNILSNNWAGIYLAPGPEFYPLSNYNVITNNTASNNDRFGIYLLRSNYNTIVDNNVSNNDYGIHLTTFDPFSSSFSSNSNIIANNTANSNNDYGIWLQTSRDNTITNNTANSNYWGGIGLSSSSNNTITDNTANSNNYDGIYLDDYNNYNTLINNTVNSNNYDGIFLATSSNNIVTDNTLNSNNYVGIELKSSSDNNIYNNFFNNTNNTGFDGTSNNTWNTSKTPGTNIVSGSYLGGNFWAKPDGTGFSETCTDNDIDGICDSNHTLASGNVDYLPLAVVTSSINISKVMVSGKTTVYTETMEYWVLEIEVINDGLTDLSSVVVMDTIPEEITLDDFTTSKGTVAATAKNGATKLTWTIGTMSPGDTETLVMGVSTKRMGRGMRATQSFLEPGEYVLNEGASVSANGGQVTAGPTDPITVYAQTATRHRGRMGSGRHSR